jgi:hypothetical protein
MVESLPFNVSSARSVRPLPRATHQLGLYSVNLHNNIKLVGGKIQEKSLGE